MTTSKKVAPPKSVNVSPKKTTTRTAPKPPAARERKTRSVGVTRASAPKKRVPKLLVAEPALETQVPIVPATPRILTERERQQLQSRHLAFVVKFQALPQLQLSEKTMTTLSIASRSLGVLIACFGIGFSLLNSGISLNSLTQYAQLTTSSTSNNPTPTPVDCTLVTNYTNTQCASVVDTTPDAQLIVGSDPANPSATVTLTATVSFARSVKMQLIDAANGLTVTPVTSMQSTTQTNWTSLLDTNTLNPGKYKVRLYINNFYGGYEQIPSNIITKSSNATQSAGSTAGQPLPSTTNTTTASSTTTTAASTLKILGVNVDNTESADSFVFYVQTQNADTVTLEAIHQATNRKYSIGDAQEISADQWRRIWSASPMPTGTYRIRVIASNTVDSAVSTALTVNKLAAPAGAASTSTVANPPLVTQPVAAIPELKPPVKINFFATAPLKGIVPMSIDVAHASSVILVLQPKNSLRFSPLGRAVKTSTSSWMYNMDTTLFPDGEYNVKAIVRNTYGEYEFSRIGLVFKNIVAPVLTEAQTSQIDTINAIPDTTKKPTSAVTPVVQSTTKNPQAVPSTPTSDQSEPNLVEAEPIAPTEIDSTVKEQLTVELDKLSVSLRLDDAETVEKITATIQSLKSGIETDSGESDEEITQYLEKMVTRTKKHVERTNVLIAERTKQKASQDSDNDLISDYDEVKIYGTNPFIPDSDNDGYLDGVEIQSGYDPLDAKPQVLVAYESPKETGIVREDILKVKSIVASDNSSVEASSSVPVVAAILSGTALPNSFITLYIFSTPIIVSIKTNSDGSWNYRLDKELEDGEHEVYIGVTDNAGKIVAKSERFAFVKRAEAFDGVVVDTPTASAPTKETGLFSGSSVNVVLGISSLAISLIFLLFGVNLHRQRQNLAVAQE